MTVNERIVSTTCPFCGVGCRLDMHVRENQILRASTPYDDIVSRGNLCVKGRFGWDFIYHPLRVLTPLMRKEPQRPGHRTAAGPDDWQPVSWEQALDTVTDRLAATIQTHGPDATAVFCCAKATNEDNYVLQKMFRAVIGTNNIDHCTRLCHAGSVVALQLALGSSAMSNTASEIRNCDVALITGSNTAETHPIIALQMKDAVRHHGTQLIVADPRRVEMVDYSALWLNQRPGTDVPLFSAMAHVILAEKLYNAQFVRERTENFEAFARSMEMMTPEYAEEISGVSRDDIVRAARLYATAQRGAIYWALGIPEHTHGTENAMALIHLALLTGHIGRPGTGLNPLRGQNNVQGASDVGAMPWDYPGYQKADDPDVVSKYRAVWGSAPPPSRGLSTTEIAHAWGTGAVKAMYIMGENPLMSEPNLKRSYHAIENLDFLVCQDIFINETGRFADIILPGCSWAEKDGTFTNTDRRVRRVRKVLEPQGDSRADWQIVCDLALRLERRLGRAGTARWDYAAPSDIMAEIARVIPAYGGITYERLDGDGLQWPVPTADHPGTRYLFENTFPRGKAKFFPLIYQPSTEQPDPEYPFIMTTGRVLYHWHGGTLTRHSQLDFAMPEPLVEINPADAPAIPCRDGDPVRVTSRRGSIVLRARVTDKASRGVVFIPFHFAEAAANMLTVDAVDPQAKIPEYKICAVTIVPATDRELHDTLAAA